MFFFVTSFVKQLRFLNLAYIFYSCIRTELISRNFIFLDSVNQVRRYSKVEEAHQLDLKSNPLAEVQVHMKLFRAQRNCYITGFALFLLP